MERNSLRNERTQDYVKDLCVAYGISGYEIKEGVTGYMTLFLPSGFSIYLDEEYTEVKLLKNEKEVKRLTKDNCWHESLDYVRNEYKK